MNKTQLNYWKKTNLFSLIYAIIIILSGDILISCVSNTNYNFLEELFPLTMLVLLVYLPFGILYLSGLSNKNKNINKYTCLIKTFKIGIIISLLFWIYYYLDEYLFFSSNTTADVNIGKGIIMLKSPIIIGIIMKISYSIFKKQYRTK